MHANDVAVNNTEQNGLDGVTDEAEMKGFLKELLASRHVRLKIECLLLLIYTMYHCGGLVSVISNDLSDDDIDAFEDDRLISFAIACIFILVTVLCIWLFCSLILTQYHYQKNNLKWRKIVTNIIKISGIFWTLALFTWVISMLSIDFSLWMFVVAIIPLWNKWLPLMLMYHIWLDLNPKTNETEKYKNKRDYRVRSWLDATNIFICGYLIGLWIIVALGGVVPIIILFPVFTTFTSLVQAISNVKDFRENRVFYFVCVPFCCCCYCKDGYGEGCVPQCCRKPQRPVVFWLIASMTFYMILVNFLLNFNECLFIAMYWEIITGFRGSALILIYYCLMAALDLNYRGPLKRIDLNPVRIRNDNDNDNGNFRSVVAPVTGGTDATQGNIGNDRAKMLQVRENSADAGDDDEGNGLR